MSKALQLQTNFTSGELSQRLIGRSDLQKYANGAQILENVLVQVHGGFERRAGTKFVAEANGTVVAAYPPRLVEFTYNIDQSYVLEFGVTTTGAGDNGYIRAFRLDSNGNPAILEESAGVPMVIDNGGGLPFRDTELASLQFTQSADQLFVFSGTRPIYKLSRIAPEDNLAASWTYTKHVHNEGAWMPQNADEDYTLTYDSAGGTITASADTFVASDVTDERLIRLSDDTTGYPIFTVTPDATLATIVIDDGLAMLERAGTASDEGLRVEFLKITKGATMLNDTVYEGRNFRDDGASRTEFDLYNPVDGTKVTLEDLPVGVHNSGDGICRFERAAFSGWAKITSFSSATVVGIEVQDDLPTEEPTTNWRLGAWSTVTGFPKCGTFFQGRLWTANTETQPQTIWGSASGNYSCFSPAQLIDGVVLDTNAIEVTLDDKQVNAIGYLIGDKEGLLVLTRAGEWLGRASIAGAPLTPTDRDFRKQSHYGMSINIEPIQTGSSVIFVQKDRRVVRDLAYTFGQDRFVAADVTRLGEHITDEGVNDSAFQRGISNRLWFVRDDGVLLTMTYEKEEEVIAWHRQILAASTAETPVAAVVLSVSTTRDSQTDNVWVFVKRDVNGADKYFIEMISQRHEAWDDHDEAYFFDCGLTGFDATPQTVWSGLDHLDGEDVYILGDAVDYGAFTVVSGSITLATAVNQISAGLRYKSVMETMPLTLLGSSQGDVRGARKRVYKDLVSVYRTLGGLVGSSSASVELHPLEYPASSSSELHTTMLEVGISDNSKRETIIRWEQQDGQPANILAIIAEVDTGDH